MFITNKAKIRRGGGRRCRCYERRRGKTWGNWILSHTCCLLYTLGGVGRWYTIKLSYTLKYGGGTGTPSGVDSETLSSVIHQSQKLSLLSYITGEWLKESEQFTFILWQVGLWQLMYLCSCVIEVVGWSQSFGIFVSYESRAIDKTYEWGFDTKVYFQENKKKAKTESKNCHTTSMWSQEKPI